MAVVARLGGVVRLSPLTKPVYVKVNVGSGAPSDLILLSAVIVNAFGVTVSVPVW